MTQVMTQADVLSSAVNFHGHMCPGLAMGIRAAEMALDRIGRNRPEEEIVAMVETDMCAVDAIQVLMGCTFGKGNLVHQDFGKNSYTFVRPSDGRAIRLSTRSAAWRPDDLEWELFSKVQAGEADAEERRRLAAQRADRCSRIMTAPFDDLYVMEEMHLEMPRPARIMATTDCSSCGEPTMETRLQRVGDRLLCIPCTDKVSAGNQVAEAAPRQSPSMSRTKRCECHQLA